MTVEWYAALVTAVGLYLWLAGSLVGSVVALMVFTLFNGGAALILGHSTVTPVSMFLAFLLAHLLLTMFRRSGHAATGFKVNGYLGFYCLYSAAAAYLLPKIFARALSIPPLLQNGQHVFYVSNALHFTAQNLTTAIYLLGTLAASVAGAAASTDPKSKPTVVTWSIIIAWAHIFFGLLGALPGTTAIIKFFRNATYAELVQTVTTGYSRISGILPEPSAYAAFAVFWFVFMTELWLRDVRPRVTMATAAALGIMIVACTSTTGYASVAVYLVIMLARFVISPASLPVSKILALAMVALTGATAALAVFNLSPHLLFTVTHILKGLTVGKADTESGQQRLYWAASSIRAFKATFGLGIGPGSFRSSSLFLAILGSTGVIGLTAFLGHFFKILKPLRRDTYVLPGSAEKAIPVAAAWAACAGIVPQLISFPTPDPGYLFGAMGGLALGWRFGLESQAARTDRPRLRLGVGSPGLQGVARS